MCDILYVKCVWWCLLVDCVKSFDNLYAGAFRQFTIGRIGWLGLYIFMRPFMVGAEGFTFGILWDESIAAVYCLPDLIVAAFYWIRTDGLEVIFCYAVLCYCVILLCRQNDCRVSFISLCNHSIIFFKFCFY